MKNDTLIVSDTGPLITLCQIDKLYILQKMFNKVYIPLAVYDELNSKEHLDEIEKINNSPFIHIESVKNTDEVERILKLNKKLHIGEIEAIIMAEELSDNNKFLIVDDMCARSYAEMRGVSTIGAIGVIAQAIRRKFIECTEVEECIDTMKSNNRFYSEDLYELLREVAKESLEQDSNKQKFDDEKNEKMLVKGFKAHMKQNNKNNGK